MSGILVIDEAYVDFAESEGASTLPLISRLPNLIVLRTFSKSFSLAGMRIGLAFASEEIISGMMKVKDSYNLNRLSLVAATAALQDMPWMTRNVRRIQQSRRQLSAGLRKMGFYVYPSHANFVMARKKEQNLKGLYERLKSQKILVRYFDVAGLQDSSSHHRGYASRNPGVTESDEGHRQQSDDVSFLLKQKGAKWSESKSQSWTISF